LFHKVKKGNKMKSLSGEALKALPKELEDKENRLNERAAELESQEAKLRAIENDLKKEAASIDERLRELKKTMGVKDSHETFLKLYNHVAEITTAWVSEKGSTQGLLSAIQKLIEARDLMLSASED
jgi:dsDNA-specific endonuclease/ATPase MutS2